MVISAGRDVIRRIVLDYGFWDGYLDRPWEDFDDDPPELETELVLLTAGAMSLEVRMLQNPNLMTLFLRQGDELLPELGYDDDCSQFLPWTFRWLELEYIARLAALRDVQVRHPGPLLALLSRFTPLTTDEEVRAARPMLAVALDLLTEGPPLPDPRFGPTLPERLAYQLDHWDCRERGSGYRWTSSTEGWALTEAEDDGWGPPTIRSPGSGHFPFPQWRTFMNDVVAAYHATVNPNWRSVPALRTSMSTGDDPDLTELADQLSTAGCDHPVVLRALRDPIGPLETTWVLELLHGEEPGSRLRNRLVG
ncbi:hypothetical protein [Dactylosporangium sp. NPDC000521]|uniref:hypothetical protein n=1 Tax=Dactylosporangium sp. NPDC000521 TaxID=3363975 RepID=UPI0036C148D2